jgi:hypothetical protein
MKSLPQISDDLKALSAFLLDQAVQLDELITFFGGIQTPKTVTEPVATPVIPAVAQESRPVRPVRAQKGKRQPGARDLTKEDKAAIKADWDALPKHLQTRENRRALAAKYRCATVQVMGLTQGPEKFQKLLASRATHAN